VPLPPPHVRLTRKAETADGRKRSCFPSLTTSIPPLVIRFRVIGNSRWGGAFPCVLCASGAGRRRAWCRCWDAEKYTCHGGPGDQEADAELKRVPAPGHIHTKKRTRYQNSASTAMPADAATVQAVIRRGPAGKRRRHLRPAISSGTGITVHIGDGYRYINARLPPWTIMWTVAFGELAMSFPLPPSEPPQRPIPPMPWAPDPSSPPQKAGGGCGGVMAVIVGGITYLAWSAGPPNRAAALHRPARGKPLS